MKKQGFFIKHTVKDSVFTALFRDKRYLLQLYRALHPEDMDTTEDDLSDITIRNVLTNSIYNDLGFRVGNDVFILIEAQSTWTMNIIVRALLYLAQTYHDYLNGHDADLYGSRKVHVPRPELYVIFTGERSDRPETISLSKEFFGGRECSIDVRVKMIYDGSQDDIIHQYISFTKVYNEQVRLHGTTRHAVLETIRICKDRDLLREFLQGREKEVISIMMTLFDDERIMRIHIANERKQAAEAATEAAAKAATEAAARTAAKAAEKMLRTGKLSAEEVAGCLTDISLAEIQEIEKELLQTL